MELWAGFSTALARGGGAVNHAPLCSRRHMCRLPQAHEPLQPLGQEDMAPYKREAAIMLDMLRRRPGVGGVGVDTHPCTDRWAHAWPLVAAAGPASSQSQSEKAYADFVP
jgi:hypothetical protein